MSRLRSDVPRRPTLRIHGGRATNLEKQSAGTVCDNNEPAVHRRSHLGHSALQAYDRARPYQWSELGRYSQDRPALGTLHSWTESCHRTLSSDKKRGSHEEFSCAAISQAIRVAQ